ncbi:hypothetical protein K3495_g2231 [Podosphaera aphanis]|nr:hypothetical protein K3495_g2231 [Podosphaera aphanis]
MAIFSLPLAASSTTHHSKPLSLQRREESKKKTKKRKRNEHLSSSDSDPQAEEQNFLDPATNPLSLNQDEITQYRLAGLELNKKVPSVAGWPHRGFPQSQLSPLDAGKTSGRNDKETHADRLEELENDKRTHKGALLRIQHVSVLTAILHKCLLKGDIARASRSWALLLRMQLSGQGIDIRNSGYWGIGAELLIRSLYTSNEYMDNDVTRERQDARDSDAERSNYLSKGLDERHILEGLRKAKDYYERLIIEHPYKRQFSSNVNALDWWPVMIGCEIYRIQLERAKALRDLDNQGTENENSVTESDPETEDDDETLFQERIDKTRLKRQESSWQARDHIHQVALIAAEGVAVRLDERMSIPPYSDNCDMLRLRGMLALYIGDLYMSPPFNMEEHDISAEEDKGTGRRRGIQRRFVGDKRAAEDHDGRARRALEIKKARSFFEKVHREGGDITDLKEYLEPMASSGDNSDESE